MSEERIKERCKREDIALKIIKGFLKKDCYTDTELYYSLNTLLDLYNKQKEENKKDIKGYSEMINSLEEQLAHKTKEIKELKEINKNQFLNYEAKIDKMEYEMGYEYISKDEVLKALGYEENGEEYKRIYNKEELILSLIRTINEECDRLEYIEDQKTMLEIHNIENQRDKYWENKIRDKIKELEKEKEKYKGDKGLIYSQVGFIQSGINALNKLLEEK